MQHLAPLVVFVAFTFALSGLVKGVIGLGLPMVAIALLGLVMTPASAASLLVMPLLLTNIWQVATGPALTPLVRRLWPMLATICVGTWGGLWSGAGLTGGGNSRATIALGIVLGLYALLGLSSIRLTASPRSEPWLSPLIGLITGFVASATGVFSVPAVLYLQAIGLEKDNLVQALGLSFAVSSFALATGLAQAGAFHLTDAGVSLLVLAPTLAGMVAGQWIRLRVSIKTFRLCFYLGLLALGFNLALRSVL